MIVGETCELTLNGWVNLIELSTGETAAGWGLTQGTARDAALSVARTKHVERQRLEAVRVQVELDAGARVLRVLSNPKCKCGDVGEKGRTCPYQADIHDRAVVCGCCDACERECCADI